MRVIRKKLECRGMDFRFNLHPLFDIHDGSAACDLDGFKERVAEIDADPLARWVGGGDYCDWINVSDHRFNALELADWVHVHDLADLARAQVEHFLELVRPIAGKCLGLIEGNHERKIRTAYERDVYREIVCGVKDIGGLDPMEPLALTYSGWLILRCFRTKTTERPFRIRLHHGHGGGRKRGGKANRMADFLYENDCDLALMGHSHDLTAIDPVVVEYVDMWDKVRTQIRKGCWCGSYLRSNVQTDDPDRSFDTYSERAGYPVKTTGSPIVEIRPHTDNPMSRCRITV